MAKNWERWQRAEAPVGHGTLLSRDPGALRVPGHKHHSDEPRVHDAGTARPALAALSLSHGKQESPTPAPQCSEMRVKRA